jgi:hypothetical protein
VSPSRDGGSGEISPGDTQHYNNTILLLLLTAFCTYIFVNVTKFHSFHTNSEMCWYYLVASIDELIRGFLLLLLLNCFGVEGALGIDVPPC